jgi:hypothetical protein
MSARTIIGITLIILGVLGFIFKKVTYTEKEKVVDLGPIELQSEDKETVPIPEILSGIAVVGGIVLVAIGSKNKKL